MRFVVFGLLAALLRPAAAALSANISVPHLMLLGINGTFTLTLPALFLNDTTGSSQPLPLTLGYALQSPCVEGITRGSFNTTRAYDGNAVTQHVLSLPASHSSGSCAFTVSLQDPNSGGGWPNATAPVNATATTFWLAGALSLLPPIVTLVVSLVTRQVLLALLLGIWVGATLLSRGNPAAGLLRAFDTYFVHAFTDGEHAGVLLFTFILGGLIAVVQKSGGALGMAQVAKRFTTSRGRAQATAFGLGCIIFFDDYSSILIVGNSLRPVMAGVGVSAEKFAVVVHTMGVCLASFFPVSSWVGVEIGYVAAQYSAIERQSNTKLPDPFVAVISSIPLRFFPVVAVLAIPMLILFGRDSGKLLEAERRALRACQLLPHGDGAGTGGDKDGTITGDVVDRELATQSHVATTGVAEPTEQDEGYDEDSLDPAPGTPLRWYNAVVPFTTVIVATFVGMYVDGIDALDGTGISATLSHAFAHCDSVSALIWASAFGWICVSALALAQRILTLDQVMQAWVKGVQDVLEPCIVLLLAWGLGSIIQDVHTAKFLAQGLSSGLPAGILPFLATLLAFVISFACGSSFGTMGILFPLVVPLAWNIKQDPDFVLQCVGALLGGAIFGNTCSPIADTTILTAAATGCDVAAHTETQMPPMMTVAVVSILFGTLPVGMGWYNEYVGIVLSLVVLAAVLRFACHRPEDDAGADQTLHVSLRACTCTRRDTADEAQQEETLLSPAQAQADSI